MNLDLLTRLNSMVQDLSGEFHIREARTLGPEDVIGAAVERIAGAMLPGETDLRYDPLMKEVHICHLEWHPDDSARRVDPTLDEIVAAEIIGRALARTDIDVLVKGAGGEAWLAWRRGERRTFVPLPTETDGA